MVCDCEEPREEDTEEIPWLVPWLVPTLEPWAEGTEATPHRAAPASHSATQHISYMHGGG